MKGENKLEDLSKQQKKERQDKLFNIIMWIPLIILLAVVPLIVRLVTIQTYGGALDALNKTEVYDVYSTCKSTAIIILSLAMAVILFLGFEKENVKYDGVIKWYLIGGGIFIVVSFISTVLSEDTHTAWWGLPDRAEGFIVIACYVLMVFYTLYAIRNGRSYIYIMAALSFLVFVSTIIGISQYLGHDILLNVEWIKELILGKEAIKEGAELPLQLEENNVVGTMFHYNYMGSFGAMMTAFFMVLTLFLKSKKQKLAMALVMMCSIFLLLGSKSRAGLIGMICVLLVLMIIFAKTIIKKWFITLPIVIGFILVLIGFNKLTGGTIFARVPMLINDAVGIFASSNEDFDYRDYIPVRDIVRKGQKLEIVLQEHSIYLGNNNGQILLEDEDGEEINSSLCLMGSSLGYMFMDERFSEFGIKMEEISNPKEGKAPVAFSLMYGGSPTISFMLDDEKGVVMVDSCPLEEEELANPPSIGFKGKEKLGSARGYIWSRSIPMMGKTFIWGYGPDNYAIKFPQNDYLGKWWAYGTPNMIVDKVHNLYIGMWINNGGLAFLGFMIVIIAYIGQSFKLYALKGSYENKEILGIASFAAVIGFLGAGLFNDSVVSVTPIFCILLGAGMGINYLITRAKQSLA